MKNFLALSLLLCVGLANAADSKYNLVSIDSILLMQKSKEGQKVAKNIQKDVETFQSLVKKEQSKLASFQDEIGKQRSLLSEKALHKKTQKLVKMKKKAERKLADNEELLKEKIQKEQLKLRNKQMVIANNLFKEKNWGLMIDKQTPGVLFVNNAIDVTDQILKAVDADYGSSNSESKKEKSV